MDNTKRFDGRADSYAKGRPGYPSELVERLATWAQLTKESTVADIGAGTGIFSGQLAETGARVFAVEPNDDMRQRANLSGSIAQRVTWVEGTAEHTGLADTSVDLVTAAQAFHWFDGPAFRDECLRVLRGSSGTYAWLTRQSTSPARRCLPRSAHASRGSRAG